MPVHDDVATEMMLKHRPSGLAMAEQQPGIKLKRVKNRKLASAILRNKPPGYLDGAAKAAKAGVICRHCRKGRVNRPKGLCWGCYYKPGVRDLYATTSKYARRGVGNFSGAAPLPTVPTMAVPGTPEKVVVMEERARLLQSLFHPADARYPNDEVTAAWLDRWAKQTLTGVAA